ncbi:hypothetical protein H9Q74_011601 [Fusarium xylarioides]|nr:hypothetical protein H9Q74_011601 [Fusarium xylarioides]
MAAVAPSYLLRDEFVHFRNRQDELLNTEFHSIRSSVEAVKTELREFKEDVREQFSVVNQRLTRLEESQTRLEESQTRLEANVALETRRSTAYSRNQALRNPSFPIHLIPSLDLSHGILYPKYFPTNATEFYSLRNPTTNRLRQLLAYLAVFYDIQPHSEDDAPEGRNGDEFIAQHPELAVDLLENIFGLNEDNFIKFKARASELANRPPEPPVRRSQILVEIASARRQKLEHATAGHSRHPQSISSDEQDRSRVGWGKLSTPTSQRQTINNIPRVQRARPASAAGDNKDNSGGNGSGSGSVTNAVTSPPGSEIAMRARGSRAN